MTADLFLFTLFSRRARGKGSFSIEKAPMLKSKDFDWIECIGTGSFSKVFYATAATRAEKEYAVKVIDKREVIKVGAQDSVFRERNIMARLLHSNICSLYFTFQDSASLYFVLELCHCGSLFSLIQFYGSLKYKHALFYTSGLVSHFAIFTPEILYIEI